MAEEQEEEEEAAAAGGVITSADGSRFGWPELVVLVAFECIAIPICIAAGEAFVSEHYARAAFGWIVGIPLAVVGATAKWWKEWLSPPIRQRVFDGASRWWPAAVFLAFVYVVGPNVYQRAVAPSQSQSPAPHTEIPATVLPPPTAAAPSVTEPKSPLLGLTDAGRWQMLTKFYERLIQTEN